MIGKLICWWTKKHKRGVRVPWTLGHELATQFVGKMVLFRCPRCGAEWTRKERNAAS